MNYTITQTIKHAKKIFCWNIFGITQKKNKGYFVVATKNYCNVQFKVIPGL